MAALFINNANAQYTESPVVDNSNTIGTIAAVVLTPDRTIVEIFLGENYSKVSTLNELYSLGYNLLDRISDITYIEYIDPDDGESNYLRINRLEGYKDLDEINNKKTNKQTLTLNTKHIGYFGLTLYFDELPKGVNQITLHDWQNGWKFEGVHIIERNDVVIERIASTEEEINQLIQKSADEHSGIYETLETKTNGQNYSLALLQHEEKICLIYLGNIVGSDETWEYGEVKAVLRPTTSKNIYKATWYNSIKEKKDGIITFESGSMTILVDNDDPIIFIKMTNNKSSTEHQNSWSGTGFAIGNGYIVTNSHVANDAKLISIKGVKGDMSTGYSAEIVANDKTNDLAIIRINDPQFKGFGAIPYMVSTRMSDVGEDVFVLGYPLTQALGNEIKLTNGIISSRTGYQGDVSTYQISAPVQPGNSGGPMFDRKGNVVGIVVAGVPGAENVGYAIKTSYLKILIESAGLNIRFPANNTISTLSLAEKVKRVKKYVLYIECSK